jgi:serine/threonine protein kinase
VGEEIAGRPQSDPRDIYHFVGITLSGRYRLEEFVDEGGMSIVYRGSDLKNNSDVAVKILAPRFLIRSEQAELYLRLFRQEAEHTRNLSHPNIVTVYDSGVENNIAFIVMEWLKGRTLGEEITGKGRLSLDRAENVLRQVCAALDVAHRRNIIHLDLKPNNIFLVDDGESDDRVKVIDFGLSRVIQSTLGTTISRVIGTPYYIAPEVFAKKAGRLSDIYSLGVVTYEILTGLTPFGTSHIYALIHQHIEREPPSVRSANNEVPEYIDELIKRAMSKNPSQRPKIASEFK